MGWKSLLIKKALVNRIPFQDKIRAFKRRILGYPPDIANIKFTIDNYLELKEELANVGLGFNDSVVMEIGSGWFPTIPLLALTDGGAKKIIASDLTPHMDEVTFNETINCLRKLIPENNALTEIKTMSTLPIEYKAPLNIDDIPDSSIDIILSRTVLEHIPEEELILFLKELRPKLSANGVMIHLIDNSDHFEHKDKTISRVNFLTWSEKKHSLINTLIKDGENRLRHHQYKAIFKDAGYQLVREKAEKHQGTLDQLPNMELAEPFRSMTHEEIAILTSIYIIKPNDVGNCRMLGG